MRTQNPRARESVERWIAGVKSPYTGLAGLLAALPFTVLLAADVPDLPEAFDAGWQGQKPCEILYETDSVRVGRCVFPPGVGHEKHFHYPHFGYVAEGGTVRIKDGTGAVEVRNSITGATWFTSDITVHEALNVGETTTSYIIVEPKPESAAKPQSKPQAKP